MSVARQLRPKKCRACRAQYTPARPLQVACSPACALAVARQAQERTQRRLRSEAMRRTRQQRLALKTRTQIIREAQTAFNAWVRERDRLLPCISCGAAPTNEGLTTGSRWDAGHYRSTGANPELRFDPDNCHRQCVRCNRDLSGNAVNYRAGLLRRIGAERLARVEGPHAPANWTRDDLIEIRDQYRAALRAMKKAASCD